MYYAVLALVAATAAATPLRQLRARQDDPGTTAFDSPTLTLQRGGGLSTPPPEPSPVAENWEDVKCDIPSLSSTFANPYHSWNTSGAPNAWKEAKSFASSDSVFTDGVAAFFDMADDPRCDLLGAGSSCNENINCMQGTSEPNAQAKAPAGWVIHNSFVALHKMFQMVYDGIETAGGLAGDRAGTMVTTFSSIDEDIQEQKEYKLMLDGLQTALIGTMAPLFHSVFSKFSWVVRNQNWVAAGFDVSYGVLGTSMAFIKDAMDAESPLPIQNELSEYFSNTTALWLKSVQNANSKLFQDAEALYKVIDMGKMFRADVGKPPDETFNAAAKALVAASLPGVWNSGKTPIYPVIATSSGTEQKGQGCEGWDPAVEDNVDEAVMFSFTDDAKKDARFCDGDNAFWLVGIRVSELDDDCGQSNLLNTPTDCFFHAGVFEIPKGWDTLDGSQWFGLSKEDVAWNAVNSWHRNGMKNGWSSEASIDWTNEDEYNSFVTGTLKDTFGAVNIPVCSVGEIAANVAKDPNNEEGLPNFPCS